MCNTNITFIMIFIILNSIVSTGIILTNIFYWLRHIKKEQKKNTNDIKRIVEIIPDKFQEYSAMVILKKGE